MSEHPYTRDYFSWGGKGEPIGYAGIYTDWPVNEVFAKKIMAMKPKSVLEIGCGYGYIVKRLNDRGVRAVGMEISEFALANRVCDEIILHDVTKVPLPFKDKEFDLCVCIETMEHIPEQYTDKVLDEIDRVCERAWFGIAYEEIDKLLWGVHGKRDKTHCFPAGTLVKLANGSEKPIEKVELSDFVLGEFNGNLVPSTVLKRYRRATNDFTRMVLGDGQIIIGTPKHPFKTKRGWIRMENLKRGDEIYHINEEDCYYTTTNRLYNSKLQEEDLQADSNRTRVILGLCSPQSSRLGDLQRKRLALDGGGVTDIERELSKKDKERTSEVIVQTKLERNKGEGTEDWIEASTVNRVRQTIEGIKTLTSREGIYRGDNRWRGDCLYFEYHVGAYNWGIDFQYRPKDDKIHQETMRGEILRTQSWDGKAYESIYFSLAWVPSTPSNTCYEKIPNYKTGVSGNIGEVSQPKTIQGEKCPTRTRRDEPVLAMAKVVSTERLRGMEKQVYNLETTTGNYFAENILVHNCNIKPWAWWEEKFKKYDGRFRQFRKETEDMSIKIQEGSERVGLNLGCFVSMFLNSDRTKWINVDSLNLSDYARAYKYNFQQHDLTKPLPFHSSSVKYAVANHLLEHLTISEGEALLRECFRVMEGGGVIRISVPDTRLLAKKYLEGTLNDYSALNEKVENAGSESERLWEMLSAGHKMFYDSESLSVALKKAGFVRVEQMPFNRSRDKEFMGEIYDTHPTHSIYFEAEKPSVVTGRGKLKICLISTPMLRTPPRHYGGLEAVVADLAEELAKKNDVTVFAARGSKIPNVEVVETVGPFEDMYTDWLRAEMHAYEIYKDRLKEFDVINGHNWLGCEYLAKMADPSLHVSHTHHGGLAGWRTKPVEKMNMITLSNWMVEVCRAAGYEARKVSNGINLDRYPFKKERGESLLFVGRIVPFKGPHIALEVANKLNMHIDFVGGIFPKLFPEYTEQFKSALKSKDATLYPDAPHEKKLEFMQNARCLLFPSNMGEPFGLCSTEAGACGCPTIAWDDGAIKEVIQDGVTGFVVPKTVEAMAEAVKKIGKIDPKDCRRRVEENFSRELMAQHYLKNYQDILDGDEW